VIWEAVEFWVQVLLLLATVIMAIVFGFGTLPLLLNDTLVSKDVTVVTGPAPLNHQVLRY